MTDFEEYIRQGEPDKKEKSIIWQTAIGLQQVDGLKPSELRTFGFKVENTPFAQNSWYFRNALVRANYNNYEKNVYATMKYLNRFFENLLFGGNNILKNRELHIDFVAPENTPNKTEIDGGVNNKNGGVIDRSVEKTVEKTVEKILKALQNNPKTTQADLMKVTGLSRRGVEWNITKLKAEGIIERIGSDKRGHWKILKVEGNGNE